MATVNAHGASGVNYAYQALNGSISWNDVPANYMFARAGIGGWKIFYVGQCDRAKNRLPTHERWAEAVRTYGATHILSHVASRDEATRKMEERDLILSHDPPMNVHHRPQTALRGLLG